VREPRRCSRPEREGATADARHASAKETLDTYTGLFEDDLDGDATALVGALAPTLVGEVWAKRAMVADTAPQT
jgi:hypothetical protein